MFVGKSRAEKILKSGNIISAAATLALLLGPGAALAQDSGFASRVKADTEWLSSYQSRQVGTESHGKVQDDLLKKIQEIPNAKVWTHEFDVVVPVYSEVYLEVGKGESSKRHDIHAFWPDVARLNTTGPDGIAGKFVYIGEGEYKDLPAHSLRGNIAVMEMSGQERYRNAFNFGASAVVFLESAEPGKPLPSQQSLYKPRYYVPPGELADALRAGTYKDGRIVCRGSWTTVTARNIYAAVKSESDAKPYAAVAPYDSMSKVVGLAPGADSALDCAILLNMLRDEAKKPRRSMLYGFLDAYHINQLGMRQMAAMVTLTPDGRTRKSYAEIEQESLEEYAEAAEELRQFGTAEEGIANLHDRYECKNLRRLFKDAVGPTLLRLNEVQGDIRLAARRWEKENSAVVRREMLSSLGKGSEWLLIQHREELTPEQVEECEAAFDFASSTHDSEYASDERGMEIFVEAKNFASNLLPIAALPLRARNHILEAAYSEKVTVTNTLVPVAVGCWEEMVGRIEGQLAEQKERIAYFDATDGIRGEIAAYFNGAPVEEDVAICSFVLGVDLSDCGILAATGNACAYTRLTFDSTHREFLRSLKKAVKRGDLWPEGDPQRRAVNVDAMAGRAGLSQLPGRALITSAAQSFLLPGVTWVTDDAARTIVDSPLDTYAELDWSRIEPQLAPTLRFFEWVLTTDEFKSKAKGVHQASAKWRNGMGRVVNVSAGETVPRVPRRGLLVTLIGNSMDVDGIRRNEFAWTGHDGSFRIPILCADIYRWSMTFDVGAYMLDEYGVFKEALTTTESLVTTRLTTSFSLGNKPGEQLPRAVTFNCAELNGPSFFDARFLEPLPTGRLQDTVRGGSPKKASFGISTDGQMWGLVEPDIRWQLIMKAGAARIRMALLNAVPDGREQGLSLRDTFQKGYTVEEELPSIPPYISATDISILNAWRLADYKTAGIESKKVDEIRGLTKECLAKAEEAVANDDGAALQRCATRALANEIRAYQAVKDVGQDISRGAIFLMLMLVPFCIAMERLLFACARIGKQIASAVAIFAVMTGLLWSFHPSFRISAQPLVIVMAFTILALSVAVISVVLSRFKDSVREFQTSLAEGSGAKMGRGGLLGSAVFLGIANMRKRKVRTMLTGATIVLVTFALLCFSSTSSYIDKKDFELEGVESKHPAVLVRRPSFGPMSADSLPAMRNLLGELDVTLGERAWLAGERGKVTWRLFLINPENGDQAEVLGALGLPAVENGLTGVDALLENWDEFAKDGGCYISQETAKRLGVEVGDMIVIRGYDAVIRGVFDALRLEDEISLLDGQRITPYDYTQEEEDWVKRDSQDAIEQELGSAAAMQPTGDDDERFISARDLVILPSEMVLEMEGKIRSYGIACDTVEQAREVADVLTQTIVYPAYYSNDEGGVNVLVSTPLIAVPPKDLAIPLVIAALIIFTTMLNSVSERKKEIYVYTSLGLAPTHVGMLFVAEALTYGLMGSVFGYIAGQGTATILTGLGMMQGVTLNYSGTAVIKTMLLVQGVVVLSAIVPAVVAGKIAAPSTEMDWHVPDPVDGVIRDLLPFTVSPSAALGLVAFIHEYLEAHRDGVLGAFDVDVVKLLPPGGKNGLAALEARLWLEPFDMGVRQKMRLVVGEEDDGACEISVEITHEAGTPKMWWRLNKPFFFDLRRQLLGWRKLGVDRILKYIESAEKDLPSGESN